jgi:hypothetical protein
MCPERINIINTDIDGVPTRLQLVSVGPATRNEIQNLEDNLNDESSTKINILSINSEDATVRGNITEKIKANQGDIVKNLEGIYEELSSMPKSKKWWTSKTIIVNILGLALSVAAIFGFQLDAETSATLLPMAMSIINIFLRFITKDSIEEVLPHKKEQNPEN